MLLLAIIPGPGVCAVVARALASGFKHSAIIVLGIVVGDLIFLLSAIYGLASIAENAHGIFLLIKYCGSAYLIYLGIKLWRSKAENIEVQGIQEFSWKSNFLTGLFITLGNPKVIFFYLGFLPSFVDLAFLSHADVIAIALLVSIILAATMLVYAYAAASTRQIFRSQHSHPNQ